MQRKRSAQHSSVNTSNKKTYRLLNPHTCTDPTNIAFLQQIIADQLSKNPNCLEIKKRIYTFDNAQIYLEDDFKVDNIITINPDQVTHRHARALFLLCDAHKDVAVFQPNLLYPIEDYYQTKRNERFYVFLTNPFHSSAHLLNPLQLTCALEVELLNQLLDRYIMHDLANTQKSLSNRCIYTVKLGDLNFNVQLTHNLAAYQSSKHPGERYAVGTFKIGSGHFANVEFSDHVLIREDKTFKIHPKKPERSLVLKRNCGTHGLFNFSAHQWTQNEAKLAAKVNVPKIQGVAGDAANNEAVLVQRFIPGNTLHDIINTEAYIKPGTQILGGVNKLSVYLRAKISRLLFEALKNMHAKNVVHRDIKPDNIKVELVFRPGINSLRDVKNSDDIVDVKSVTIIDYGLAKDASRLDVNEKVGSRRYSSVEAFRREGTDRTSDVDGASRCLTFIWGSMYIGNSSDDIGPAGLRFFTTPQTSIPNLFIDTPISDAELHPFDKKLINDVLLKYSHPNKSQRPQTEDEAIALFTALENKYKPQVNASMLKK